MFNKAVLVGRLGRDPELKYTPSGQAVVNLSLATDESYKDKSGEWQQKTEWHRVTAWGKLAEAVGERLAKGSLALVEGKIQTRKWDDKSGNKRETVEIVASKIRFLDNKGPDKEVLGGPATQEPEQPQVSDEDIPF